MWQGISRVREESSWLYRAESELETNCGVVCGQVAALSRAPPAEVAPLLGVGCDP